MNYPGWLLAESTTSNSAYNPSHCTDLDNRPRTNGRSATIIRCVKYRIDSKHPALNLLNGMQPTDICMKDDR